MILVEDGQQLHLRHAYSRLRVTIGTRPVRTARVSRMNWTGPVYSLVAPVLPFASVGSVVGRPYRRGMPDADQHTNDNLLAAVGLRIKNLRELKQITPKDFAKAAGFSLSYLWRLESGQQNLNLKSISRIAIALGEPMTALLEGIEPDPATIEVRPYAHKAKRGAKVEAGGTTRDQAQGSA
jgi:transcriptional regulator with XRE-family HTH domain